MIGKRERNGILCSRECSFHSRSLLPESPFWKLVTFHPSQFSMGTVCWSLRNLKTVRVRQTSAKDAVPEHQFHVPFHTQVRETHVLPRAMLLPLPAE